MLTKPPVAPLHTAVKGRVRFRVRGLAYCAALKIDLETIFAHQPGIRSASASTLTGNLLVHHGDDLNWKQVCAMVTDYISGWKSRHPANPTPINADRQNNPGTDRSNYEVKVPVPVIPVSNIAWFQRDRIDTLRRLGCDRQKGLADSEAEQRLREWGANTISELKGRSVLRMLIDQISSTPLVLLGLHGILAAATGGWIEAALVAGVIAANVSVGYAIDARVQKRILALRRAARPEAEVIRGGKRLRIPGADLVVGDLLILAPGTYVGADSRIVWGSHLKIDESSLTGESIPVDKHSRPIGPAQRSLADQSNMAFMGTLVVGGKGLAAVVATGLNSEYGKMLALTTETFPPRTPLTQQLESFSRKLMLAGGLIAAVVLGLRIWRGLSILDALRFALPLGATAMPAALPTAATANMAVGIQRLKKNDVSIRQLYALETMGAVKVICFDKTGTITRDRITVHKIYAGGRHLRIKHRRIVENGRLVDPRQTAGLQELISACVLCNESRIEFTASGKPQLKGSPTETALLHLALLAAADIDNIYHGRRLESVKHRGKHRRRMVTVHREPDGSARISVKGDPMEVAATCRWQLKDGRRTVLSPTALSEIESQNAKMTAEALRVLGFACKFAAPDEEFEAEDNLIWLGMIGMAEPIRVGVRRLMEDLHQAGIETVMITGDQSLTADAVARKVRLAGSRDPRVMDSTQFEGLRPDLLEALVRDVQVFSRVNPSQKLQIVMALQKRGYTVAMTGDGINDGPALRAADIGIAMGLGGTDVAREVADIILEKDDIRAIRPAVSGGRAAYANLKSSFHYCLASNFSEIVLLTAASAGAANTPLIAAQPLGINVFSDILPALSLLMEPGPRDLSALPPGDPEAPMFDRRDAARIITEATVMAGTTMAAYGCGMLRYGAGVRSAALAHESLAAARLLHAYNCRRNGQKISANPFLALATASSLAMQLMPFGVPALRRLLNIAPLTPIDLTIAGAGAVLSLFVNRQFTNR